MSAMNLIGDHNHNGPNQAGNKSMLAYRSDIGVPGYTGYIPATTQVVLPTKLAPRTGRPVEPVDRDTATLETIKKTKQSEYISSFNKAPSDTRPTDKTGGGYWITQRHIPYSPPFTAISAYKAEIQQSEETASKQLDRTLGLRCTLPMYEAARKTAPRSQTADPSLRNNTGHLRFTASSLSAPSSPLQATQRPMTAMTSQGEIVGYQTSAGAAFVPQPLVGGPAAPGTAYRASMGPPAEKTEEEVRYKVMPHAMAPGLFGASTAYRRDHGVDCSDPMERSAPGERFQSRMTTSRDLAFGTPKVTNNLPGYTGHIAASRWNGLAQAQTSNPDERVNRQNDMLLFTNDQFSRSRLPGYTGYKPQAPRNITLDQPSQGPTTITTMGSANHMATKQGLPLKDGTFHKDSLKGTMGFFESSGPSISDNGIFNAQLYYKMARPEAAKLKFTHAPHSTLYGKMFHDRNSLC